MSKGWFIYSYLQERSPNVCCKGRQVWKVAPALPACWVEGAAGVSRQHVLQHLLRQAAAELARPADTHQHTVAIIGCRWTGTSCWQTPTCSSNHRCHLHIFQNPENPAKCTQNTTYSSFLSGIKKEHHLENPTRLLLKLHVRLTNMQICIRQEKKVWLGWPDCPLIFLCMTLDYFDPIWSFMQKHGGRGCFQSVSLDLNNLKMVDIQSCFLLLSISIKIEGMTLPAHFLQNGNFESLRWVIEKLNEKNPAHANPCLTSNPNFWWNWSTTLGPRAFTDTRQKGSLLVWC